MKKRRKRKVNKKRIGAVVCIALTALTIKLYPYQIFTPGEWSWDLDHSNEKIVYQTGIKCENEYIFTDTIEEVKAPEENVAKTNEVAIIEPKIEKATNISDKGIKLIKKYEGCKLEAYKLKGESNYTIGYGTSNRSIRKGQRITEKEAEKMLLDEIAKIEKYLNKKDIELNQNEYDALVSFGFNCGIGNLNKLISGRNKEEIADHIMAYTGSSNASNRRGLEKRRTEELNMFLGI